MAHKDELTEARRLYGQAQADAAADILEDLVEREPDNIEARLLLARVYSRMRLGEDAVEEIEAVLERRPDDSEALTLRGAEHYFADELDEAEETLERAIELDPDNAEARARLAQVYTDRKLYTDATEILGEGEEVAGERGDAMAMVRMAQVYLAMQQRQHPRALQLIEENEDLWAQHPYIEATVRSNQAVVVARQRDYSRARELLVDVLDIDPYFYTARALLGQIAAMQRDHETAVDQLTQVLEVDDDVRPQVRYALASSLAAMGRHEEANEQYRAALEAGLSGVPAMTARASVLIPNLRLRLAAGGVVLLLLALVLLQVVPPFMAIAIVAAVGLLGWQILRGVQ